MKKHYGKLINQIIRDNGHSVNSVAKHLSITKEGVKHWLDKPMVELEIIEKIGKVIIHNFENDFPELYLAEELYENEEDPIELDLPQSVLSVPISIENPSSWKDKYIRLLEEYNNRLSQAIESGHLERRKKATQVA